ncbi:hypothetical protein A3765_08470 [Oleiphilus sp. HI0130]|nr:hypothetical protein A3765_08470 [Oleiphilus sp. HI0130]
MSDYYEANADEFFTSTKDVDMSPLYEKFLPHIPKGGHILDAGCGSGRDSKYFLDQGYKVTAIEPAEALRKLASEFIRQPVEQRTFQEINEQETYDGIWACASLLHVPRSELNEVFEKLFSALKPRGVLYCSFKYGEIEREKEGRFFNDMNKKLLRKLINHCGIYVEILSTWVTDDRRSFKRSEQWVNALIVKTDYHKLY